MINSVYQKLIWNLIKVNDQYENVTTTLSLHPFRQPIVSCAN